MLDLKKNIKFLTIVCIVIVVIVVTIILYFALKPSCKKFHYKPYAWTGEDTTKLGSSPSESSQKNYCEKTLKKFWKGSESSVNFPGCSTAWCCTKQCDN